MVINEAEELSRAYLNYLSLDPASSAILDETRTNPETCALSVIIPCYNVEQQIERCVTSVLTQFDPDKMELILVNDGSTDRTGELLEPYRGMDGVTVIDQENRGLAGARNSGLRIAGGQYFFFLDSDDYLLPDTLDPMLLAAIEADADIVEAKIQYLPKGTEEIHVDEDAGAACIAVSPYILSGYAWGKMLKRTLFEGLRFPEGYWFEDSVMSWLVYPKAQKAYYYPKRVVCYCENDQGIMAASEEGNPKVIDSWWITEQMHRDYLTLEYPMTEEFYQIVLRQIAINCTRMKALADEARVAVFQLTTAWYNRYFADQYKKTAQLSIIEKALRIGRFDLYERACEVVGGKG
ncbi:MAG: glycosyltransferase [Lachnospiraceae bacterium]|nr:glycosyltransferase [Lachnospiraceae bacterium]